MMDKLLERKKKLSDSILSNRNLPEKPDPIELYGKYVKILPLDIDRDALELFMVSNGSSIQRPNKFIKDYNSNELIWKFTRHEPFTNIDDFIKYLHEIQNINDRRVFCIFDAVENYQIGIVGYITNSPKDLNIEIGALWISPIAQGTNAALEICYLMLNHAFEIGYRRVQYAIFKENVRSKKLAEKAGFTFENIQKSSFIYKNIGFDLSFFRILDSEWLEIKKTLNNKLGY